MAAPFSMPQYHFVHTDLQYLRYFYAAKTVSMIICMQNAKDWKKLSR